MGRLFDPDDPAVHPAGAPEELLRHGGRLAAAQAAWPDAPRPWLDLSTGISPWRYPAPRVPARDLARLPDPERLRRLEATAAAAFGVADPARVVAVAGAEAALRLLPRLLPAPCVAIAAPTYGGHAEAWRAAGAQVVDDIGDAAAGAVVQVNPNNPDGRVTAPGELLRRADALAARGGWLVVDESFADATPAVSVAGAAHPAVVALRSFGKFYGLAGLRLGFVIAPPAVTAPLRALLGDWPVSAPALAAGLAAYADATWRERMPARLRAEGARLDRLLGDAGFEPVGGAALFRLVSAPDARRRFGALAAQGVLARPFAHDAALLRFGLPHPRERGRLRRALAAL